LEGRAVLASYDPAADMLNVWSATQTPHLCRGTLADLFERDLESIRVIAPFVGGGFGTKAPFYPEEAVIPAAAMKLGRPVKWQEDRREHFLASTQERDQYWKVGIAVDNDGKIPRPSRQHAARHRRLSAVGHHRAVHRLNHSAGPLCHPGLQDRKHRRAHQPGADHRRARRRPPAGRVRDGAAHRPRRPRIEDRPRRIARPQHHPARPDALFTGPDLSRRQADGLRQRRFSQEPASAPSSCRDTKAFAARQSKARAEGRYLGIGIGNYVEGTGLGPFEGVTIRIMPNGKVAVATGATTQGQGTRTTLSQIVADHLGCRIEDIVMSAGDTGTISQGIGAFASRQAINAGSSAMIAGDNVRKQVIAAASRALGIPESDIDVEDGKAIARTGNKPSLTVRRVGTDGAGHAGLLIRAGANAGAGAHRLFHAAAGVLLQRHPCR
jgi:carbon-monoxide dehydrogenase large subunit